MSSPLFLGFDLSTQQLKAIVIAEDASIVHESAVHFDIDLPAHGTTNGAVKGPDEGEVTSPVLMWLEAIDLVMQRVKNAGVDLSAIAGISGAGQQHGSVYWSEEAEKALAVMDPKRSLADPGHLAPHAFALPNAPIWQDSSTTKDCRNLEAAVGGPQVLADLTGSRAYERFTGPQIARIRRLKPAAYHDSARISLVSSFIPSLFLGHIAPIEVSDASGMNLMNVLTCKWDDALLEACGGPELRAKIGPEPVVGGTILGRISQWWVERWGFNQDCIIAPFTGDNSATVVALSAPGDALLSLGTSTTFLLSIPPADLPPARFTTSHLLSHPTTLDAQIAMLCYKNGALAREQIRNRCAGADWARYNELVEQSPQGSSGFMGFYFPLPEIIPPGVQGEFIFQCKDNGEPRLVHELQPDASQHARAILESQFLSIKSRITAILPAHSPPLQRLIVTGGSSANQTIRQLAADVFGMRVYVAESKEAAGTGGAVLAKFAWWKAQVGGANGSFEEMTMETGEVERMRLVAIPKVEVTKVYDGLVDNYRRCEEQVVYLCGQA
ncbi:actin-like ATPase domain-containing protein [Suillus weaverae]|nr:actin-like ATPase domain-containing protein [Suillus weaverae]